MALISRILIILCVMTSASVAYWRGSKPTLQSVVITVNGVTQNVLYISNNPSIGTTVGTVTTTQSFGQFNGSLALSGANASNFTLSGSSIQSATALPSGTYTFTVTASNATMIGSPVLVNVTAYVAAQYFISPTGNDSNTGLSSSAPWLTPNHAINCGDTITAASGTYSFNNFAQGTWGAVSCPGNDNVAWVTCVVFASCIITGDHNPASMYPGVNYWGISGWVLENNPNGACVAIVPPTNTANVHHVAIVNNVLANCGENGISIEEYLGGTGPTGVDYSVIVGNLTYNDASNSSFCFSGISLGAIANQDNAPGTHHYLAYNISWGNVDGPNCDTFGTTTDGEGIIIDRPDVNSYSGGIVVENNLLIGNGSKGFQLFDLTTPSTASAVLNLLVRNNTIAHNMTDVSHDGTDSSDANIVGPESISQVPSLVNMNATVVRNLMASNQVTCCVAGAAVYALLDSNFTNQSFADNNWIYGLGSPNQNVINYNTGYRCFEGANITAPGVGTNNTQVCSGNTLSTDPVFANPVIPGSPNCSGQANTQNCMATTIAGFTPTANGSTAYGFNVAAPNDSFNMNAFICNVMRTLPSSMNRHCGPVPATTITAIALGNNTVVGGSPSGTVVGTIGVATTGPQFSGTLSLSGAGAPNFQIVGNTLETNGVIPTGTYSINIVATQAAAIGSPFTQPETIVAQPTISAVTLTGNSFFAGSPSGTVIGTIGVTISNGSFTGTLSLTGTNASSFQIVGNTLETNGVLGAGSYSINIVATQTGAIGSPFSQPETITGTTTNVAFTPLTQYFMSPTGSDANDGLAPTTGGGHGPWLTPNHAVHCGDVILAQTGTYTFNNDFGTVSNCPSTSAGIDGNGGIYFATILCSGTLGSCINNRNWHVNSNFWAAEGWSCSPGSTTRCYEINAQATDTTQVHHVAFINDISINAAQAVDCNDQGRNHNVPGNGCDYMASVGVIAQNSAQDTICLAAIDAVGMSNIDNNAGTHLFFYNNYAWANLSPSCISKFDGEDIMLDTWDAHGYTGQGIVSNNIGFTAERYGIQVFYQQSHLSAPVIKIYNNTLYNDLQNTGSDNTDGEINFATSSGGGTVGAPQYVVSVFNNITQTISPTSPGGTKPIYAYVAGGLLWNITLGGTGTQNIFKGDRTSCTAGAVCDAGHNIALFNGNSVGTNTYADPLFTNATDLINNQNGAPTCTGFVNTTQCLGWNANTSTLTTPSIISDLVPTASGMTGKGFQLPSTLCASNSDYPTWLKGIVYLQASGFTANPTITENADLATKPCGM